MSIISVHNLGKRYRLGQTAGPNTLRDRIALGFSGLFNRRGGKQTEEFWALRDVSFEVQEGEVLGIIGRNGAGKSTLLKILSQITEPTTGEVRIRGRVASLLEVGTGFHNELSGRENIYLNGAILGMSKAEIRSKFDEIVSFSGIEKFIDTPVKRYSSGMTVRLAFAVAAHLEPEILLIDEVLAVGDVEFQKKCLGKMENVAKGGRTILFVSHNMAAVEGLCGRSLLLEGGKKVDEGETSTILQLFQASMSGSGSGTCSLSEHIGRTTASEKIMEEVQVGQVENPDNSSPRINDDLLVRVRFNRHGKAFKPVLGVVVKNTVGVPIFCVDNRFIPGYEFNKINSGIISCIIPKIPLMPGRYLIDLFLGDESRSIDTIKDAIGFDVMAADVYGSGRLPYPHSGTIVATASWTIE